MKFLLAMMTLAFSCTLSANDKTSIIYIIGDGMGPAYTTAYRYYINSPAAPEIDPTIFDQLLVGMASTYPDDDTVVTDSAAAATALASGRKTYNGAVGVDPQQKPLPTLLEAAKRLGYKTGVVVTSQINHATPASFVAHVDHRKKYNEIADQFLDQRIAGRVKVDLMLGGGLEYFKRQDRNLVAEFEALGYQSIVDFNQLLTLKSLPAIGLFAPKGMEHAIDSHDKTRLATMTDKALSLMEGMPFFLLVEGSQIDWCGHDNDIACAMAEMHDFGNTLKIVKHYVDTHPNTLMVATADHSTGGLTLGAHGKDQWLGDVVKKVKASSGRIVEALLRSLDSWQNTWQQYTGIALTDAELNAMQAALDAWQVPIQADVSGRQKREKFNAIKQAVMKIINQRSHTGWTSVGHTAVDVQIFSAGKGSEAFVGSMDNTDIAKKLFTVLHQ